FPRKVTAPWTTSTLIFLSGVFVSPISLATILVWIQASSSDCPIVSLFALAFSRSSRACSSLYCPRPVAGVVASARGVAMFAFAGARALAFALAFSFMLVLQAATPKTTVAAAASNRISLVFIFASSLEKGIKGDESPASPFAGDPFAQILDGLAYFAAGPANFLLNVSFNPFVYASLLQVGVARQLTKLDRKSTRLNSSHVAISYAVFCWKKKRITVRARAATT